jgi:crotonobetainyl-CoA:carnitine CoA-transferase CaiB-like acyl-CoA transferase
MPDKGPLDGILVLDLTRAVAGPFCTMLLGDLGARVIKIEEEGRGDETRQWGPPFVQGISAYFLGMNRNKESVAVNLKTEEGRRLLLAISDKADVLVENFRPGVLDRLGFGYDALGARNPRLIYCSVSGFGQTGRDRLRSGYDLIVQGLSGLMYTSAAEGDPPVKCAFPVSDIAASLFAGQAILASLVERGRTGTGRYVEISLLEAMMSAMTSVINAALLTGDEPPRPGTAQPNIVPYQMFQCADAPIVTGAPNERLFERFCAALDHPEWLADPRFQGNASRNRHRTEMVHAVSEVLTQRPVDDWVRRLGQFEIPCAPVATILQALDNPQLADRNAFPRIAHPALGSMPVVANPMRFRGFDPLYQPPPDLGDHTESVRREFLGENNQSHGF